MSLSKKLIYVESFEGSDSYLSIFKENLAFFILKMTEIMEAVLVGEIGSGKSWLFGSFSITICLPSLRRWDLSFKFSYSK